MNNLEQKIIEFSQAIRETKEWREYDAAARTYESDKGAQKLLEDLQMAQGALDILEQGNFSGHEEQRKAYNQLLDEVRANHVINEWFDTRRRLEPLIGELAAVLSQKINFPFALPLKKGCGCG